MAACESYRKLPNNSINSDKSGAFLSGHLKRYIAKKHMEIITRKEAIARGLKRYFTGKKCKNGHFAQRIVSKYACTECLKAQERRSRKTQSNQKYSSMLRRSAKQRSRLKNLEFDLTHEWSLQKVEKGICEVTGLPFKIPDGTGKSGPSCFSPSFDRIKPNEGYTMENTRIVIHSFNAAKNDGTDEDVLLMARALVERYGK